MKPLAIRPVVAYVEYDCPIEDFYDEWEALDDVEEPTQKDYEDWAFTTAMGFLQRDRYELDDRIKLKSPK